jgi:hypothetical protein
LSCLDARGAQEIYQNKATARAAIPYRLTTTVRIVR